MAQRKSERVTLRLSNGESKVLNNIKQSGEFEDISTTIRFCINFTNTILRVLPESIGLSFLETEKEKKE